MNGDIILPPEIESGNKEYKLKIIPDNEFRLEQLASQMKWRLNEGNGIAYYYIGIDNDGTISGICNEDFSISIKNLNKIVKFINAKIIKTDKYIKKKINWYIVTIKFNIEKIYNSRIIFIGPSDSGKTTLISNLVNNISDDGNGKSRKLVFNHKHEIYSGRTSSISIEKKLIKKNNEKHCLNLIDTPGYSKYLKTTITALMKYDNNLLILCINPLDIKFSELKFYFDLIIFLNKNFLLILTKKDQYKSFHKTHLLKNILEITGQKFYINNLKNNIIEVDNILKIGYSKILKLFNEIDKKNISSGNLKFQICDIIKIPNLGKIYTGILLNGILNKNKKYIIYNSDVENEVTINSIQYIDRSLDKVENNQLVTIQLDGDDEFCNKTDKIISDCRLKSVPFLKVKSNSNIESNLGICIYNNQYCVVSILKHFNFYILHKKDGFINVDSKIILKINDNFIFTHLIN